MLALTNIWRGVTPNALVKFALGVGISMQPATSMIVPLSTADPRS